MRDSIDHEQIPSTRARTTKATFFFRSHVRGPLGACRRRRSAGVRGQDFVRRPFSQKKKQWISRRGPCDEVLKLTRSRPAHARHGEDATLSRPILTTFTPTRPTSRRDSDPADAGTQRPSIVGVARNKKIRRRGPTRRPARAGSRRAAPQGGELW